MPIVNSSADIEANPMLNAVAVSLGNFKINYMEVVDKKNVTIQTGFATVDHKKFLNEILPPFEKVMVGVGGGKEPFAYIYFEVSKQDIIDTVRMNQCQVTFSIMFNSKVKQGLVDILYIKKLKQSVL